MLKVIVGVVSGLAIASLVYIGLLIYLVTGEGISENTQVEESRQCMTQQVHLRSIPSSTNNYPYIIVGESVICGRDWQISNIYGPDVETFYGRIELRDWDSEEFIREEENDKYRKDN